MVSSINAKINVDQKKNNFLTIDLDNKKQKIQIDSP